MAEVNSKGVASQETHRSLMFAMRGATYGLKALSQPSGIFSTRADCEGDKDSGGKCPSTTDPYSMWKQKPAFVLLASVVNAGGTQHNHKTLWTALTTGDKITYSGGVVVNAFLWSAGSSSPVYVDVLRYRAPFSKIKSPGDVSGLDSGDNLR